MRRKNDDWTIPLNLRAEIIADNFAGGGGATTGIEAALGRSVDIAVNHDPEAIAMHAQNHPETVHYCESVFDVDPIEATGNQPVGLAWFSPDCRHHSRAKGKKPKDNKIRGLSWIVLKWGVQTKFRVGALENVSEIKTWAPLDENNQPIEERKGETFQAFIDALTTGLRQDHPAFNEIRETLGPDFPYQHLFNGLGYTVEWRELVAADYGAPTIRKRLFMIMRRDGLPIVWPEPTHGHPESEGVKSGRLKPWRTAAECIDWTITTKSIFKRKKPLAENTMKRIARGMKKYVLDAKEPFIVRAAFNDLATNAFADAISPFLAKFRFDSAGASLRAPIPVITAGGDCERPAGAAHAMGLVVPILLQQGHTGDMHSSRCHSPLDPYTTMTGSREKSLLTAHLVGIDNKGSGASAAWSAIDPLRTTTTENRHALVVAHMIQQNGGFYDGDGRSTKEPFSTFTSSGSQQQVVVANLIPQFDNSDASAVDVPGKTELMTSHLVKMYGTCEHGQAVDSPLPTITAGGQHIGEVRARLTRQSFLSEPDRACATNERDFLARRDAVRAFAQRYLGIEALLVCIDGIVYEVVDIGLRMLVPRELFRGQGFPNDYVIEFDYKGKRLSKSAQVRMCGNSVSPPVAEALIRANFVHEHQFARVA